MSCCPPDGRSQLLICNKMELGVMWVIKLPMMAEAPYDGYSEINRPRPAV